MHNEIDAETGEVLAPRMPPEIAEATLKVKEGIKQLGFDERNEHGKYSYASVDKFYIALRPLEVEAGIEILLDETGFDVRAGDSGKAAWVFINYDLWLTHRSGIMWGPLRRHIAMPITGPQAFGAAESYVLKAFRRGLYMVPTGDSDADDTVPRDDAPTRRAGAPQTQGRLRQHLGGGNGASAPQAPARTPAEARFNEIKAEIDAASSIEALNSSGIFGPTGESDKELIGAVKFPDRKGGEITAWDRLCERDARRRESLIAADKSLEDFG